MSEHVVFIGGGNMASAMIGGLRQRGYPIGLLDIVEPFEEARKRLHAHFGIAAHAEAGAFLERSTIVVWAVKPQIFQEVTIQLTPYLAPNALHISVAAGIRSDSIARWLANERVIRAMPNTPALIGKGMTGLFAREATSSIDRENTERIISGMGDFLWLEQEQQLDAVTALSGSGPAYMFYLMEAMIQAGAEMGLSREQAYRLATATFIGTGELAQSSNEPPEILRHRVTSKGGTTYAAITNMDANNIKGLFTQALHAAHQRAIEMGDEFGAVQSAVQ